MVRLLGESQNYIRGGQQKREYAPDEVVEVACPLCGRPHRTWLSTEHGAIGVSRCADCSLIYTSPRLPAPEQVYWGDASRYYEGARLIFHGKAGRALFYRLSGIERLARLGSLGYAAQNLVAVARKR